ncbi:hypothetical protein [Caloranaerobacter azorensis]|uniref:Uncharacterized protein n=1 Tax=Caloranaerobacter azorensis TaxID=116090 RepID=A0A6P1YEL3_9FIRM|nr:hypothetical protein [Caloranaerobacter azorensis]QIB27809.1 hypothetical protein G3A45_11250 [Caloranaerobacter azorensis]
MMRIAILIILLIPFIMLQTYIIKDILEVARKSIKRSSYSKSSRLNKYDYYRRSKINKNNIRAAK